MSELKRELNMIKAQAEDSDGRKNKMITINSESKEKIIQLQTQVDMLHSENQSKALELDVKRKHIQQLDSDRENLTKLLDSNKKGWDSNDARMSELMKENQGLHDGVFKFQSELNRLHEENRH
jgi:tRNA U34 5-carboxymethylaminomethyl modifying GTPase MnmE/TrmE